MIEHEKMIEYENSGKCDGVITSCVEETVDNDDDYFIFSLYIHER